MSEFQVRVVSHFDLAVEPPSPTPFPPSVPGFAKMPTTQADLDSPVQPSPSPPTPAAFLPSKGKKHRRAHTHTHVRVHMRTLTAPLTAEPMQDRACLEAQDSDFTPPKAPPSPQKL